MHGLGMTVAVIEMRILTAGALFNFLRFSTFFGGRYEGFLEGKGAKIKEQPGIVKEKVRVVKKRERRMLFIQKLQGSWFSKEILLVLACVFFRRIWRVGATSSTLLWLM